METKLHFIGFDGEKVVNRSRTLEQIEQIMTMPCGLAKEGEALTWADVYNPDEPRSLFSFILRDRKMRVDDGQIMADRPPIAVLTEQDGQIVRIEFYEGHDALDLSYDIRATTLQGQDLPRWMEEDPEAYDPGEFLRSMGFPEEAIEIIAELHKPAAEGV